MGMDKSMVKNAGPAFVAIGVVFMVTVNAGVGAAFLAIGAALIAREKQTSDAEAKSDGEEQ